MILSLENERGRKRSPQWPAEVPSSHGDDIDFLGTRRRVSQKSFGLSLRSTLKMPLLLPQL
jgi:hypothetical protein